MKDLENRYAVNLIEPSSKHVLHVSGKLKMTAYTLPTE
jgi:hypothetical protein